MKLGKVFNGLDVSLPQQDFDVTGLCMDSREARPGNIFFAVSGFHTDGSLFIGEAVVKGCRAIVAQKGQGPASDEIGGAPIITVPDIHKAMSLCANNFFNAPSRRVEAVGITGTNGKTTTSYFLEAIYQAAGIKPGVIGTVNYRCGGEVIAAAVNTTPPALKLQECMAMMADCGCKAVIMEVSSHSLAYDRVKDMDYDAAVFTNFSQDHLDFHKTMENYLAAKAKLFALLASPGNSKKNRSVAINGDDPACETVLKGLGPDVRVTRFGTSLHCEWRASEIETALGGTSFNLHSPLGSRRVSLKLWGGYNVFNALAAMACASQRGIPFEKLVEGVTSLERVPGRMEPVSRGQNFHVFVDFAHTERALESVL
ncbi:MAG: UDP-N-acetylmuramoyl-L-alanyl-D-glutamate--2,6-diaminopimelate ligase, partial [Elusimicrobia bacterium]|nr:UDP-N-acetylmuramoyl-L-alanyl-D-glutamate--2,6-diaminopimelate ligase [Elusimicrobiota bacterium]